MSKPLTLIIVAKSSHQEKEATWI